jgi:hypothetical protein
MITLLLHLLRLFPFLCGGHRQPALAKLSRCSSTWTAPAAQPIKDNFTTYYGELCFTTSHGAVLQQDDAERCHATDEEAVLSLSPSGPSLRDRFLQLPAGDAPADRA